MLQGLRHQNLQKKRWFSFLVSDVEKLDIDEPNKLNVAYLKTTLVSLRKLRDVVDEINRYLLN